MTLHGVLNGLKLGEMLLYKEDVLIRTVVVRSVVTLIFRLLIYNDSIIILLLNIEQASRHCNSEGVWADPDVMQCQNMEFVSILEQVSEQFTIIIFSYCMTFLTCVQPVHTEFV